MTASKIVAAAASGAGSGATLDVDDVFSTFLYEGSTGTAQTFVNGVDLTEGGLVWGKARNSDKSHWLHDTERGTEKVLRSNADSAEVATSNAGVTSFNNNGFTVGNSNYWNENQTGLDYVSWTFRKAPKFFDIVTYTGNGVNGRNVPHNLGVAPGMIVYKALSAVGGDGSGDAWWVDHRGLAAYNSLRLNATDSAQSNYVYWTTRFDADNLNLSGNVNHNGINYVAYLFAHNDGDGEFGPDSDQDIIKCGSYTGNASSTGPVVDLGFEPQWLLVKNVSTHSNTHWYILDVMRGWDVGGSGTGTKNLKANVSDAEQAMGLIDPNSTGFQVKSSSSVINGSGNKMVYMAIRRGPLAVPDDATKVFAIDTQGSTTPKPPGFKSGFSVDFAIRTNTSTSFNNQTHTRLLGDKFMSTNLTTSEASYSTNKFDYQDGYFDSTTVNSSIFAWMWKRAPGYFDVVCYDGQNNYGQEPHNLAVPPEILISKGREETSYGWSVVHTFANSLNAGKLNSDVSFGSTYSAISNFTSTHFPRIIDWSGQKNIAYLFASAPGVSKCGTYTGTGSSAQTISCGFSAGAKMVIIKCVSHNGQWYIFDVNRGITATVNDGVLMLNNTTAQSPESSFFGASVDAIQPDNSGFKVQHSDLNASGRTFLFYAVA